MYGINWRRGWAGFWLVLLLCGPLGPPGAGHVAHVPSPPASEAGASLAGPQLGHHGAACAICHLLTGLRYTPAAHPAPAPAEVRFDGLARTAPSLRPSWLGDTSASRAPPRS